MSQRIQVMTIEGHVAARNNCKILIDLFNRGKYGKTNSLNSGDLLSFIFSKIRILGLGPCFQQPLYYIHRQSRFS